MRDAKSMTRRGTDQWSQLVDNSFRRRVRPEELSAPVKELWSRTPISGAIVASLFLKSGARISNGLDPLIPGYLEVLLSSTSIDTCDVLIALLAQTRYASKETADQQDPTSQYDLVLQENILALLSRQIASGLQPKTALEAKRAVRALAEWTAACNYHETMLQVQAEGLRQPPPAIISALEALATFAVALFSNQTTRHELLQNRSKDLKGKLSSTINSFVSLLGQYTTSSSVERLQLIARTPPLADKAPEFSMSEIASAVTDLPVSISRTGLYIYFHAALCARPLTNDLTLLNYLHSRYQGDTQSLVVDLIVASFDTLANALHRNRTAQSLLCYRSFIANKLPLLLTALTPSLFPHSSVQLCIHTALSRIDVHPFPPLSSENDGVNEALKSSRQDFLQACIMHQLGSDSAFASFTGDTGVTSGSRRIKYNEENLATQCVANVHRVDQLVRELDTMNGNAGAISGALVRTLQHFCDTKETMSLRTLCNALSRKLSLLDIILQYTQPLDLLSPLCRILNEWSHDEEQSEFQPPYEEFASILLLVLAATHRYQLSISDLGQVKDTFVLDLLVHISDTIPIDKLTPEQSKHLSKWMQQGLYATDEHGQPGGISDEPMIHCPPQNFYLLVPTLLEQSIHGCTSGALALDTLKGGLEFLLEPFLLPSLIGGISWLTKHSWEDHGDAEVLINVLNTLLLPPSISDDGKAMHETIIAMIAAPLERSLRELDRRIPNREEISKLMKLLKAHLNTQRSNESSISEINQWSSTPGGGLRKAIRDVMAGLVMWSGQSAINPVPTNYTHRMVMFAIEAMGADEVLHVVVEEVRAQTQVGSGSSALEVATALVCAPVPVQAVSNSSFDEQLSFSLVSRRTLRQALRDRLSTAKDLLGLETGYVEALVRLGRRVDAQSAVPQIDPISMPMASMDTQTLMQDINMTEEEIAGNTIDLPQPSSLQDGDATEFTNLNAATDLTASAGADMGTVNDPNTMQLDLSGHLFDPSQDLNFDMAGTSQSQVPGQTSNTDDDIFAGLDMGDMGEMGDDDFSFG